MPDECKQEAWNVYCPPCPIMDDICIHHRCIPHHWIRHFRPFFPFFFLGGFMSFIPFLMMTPRHQDWILSVASFSRRSFSFRRRSLSRSMRSVTMMFSYSAYRTVNSSNLSLSVAIIFLRVVNSWKVGMGMEMGMKFRMGFFQWRKSRASQPIQCKIVAVKRKTAERSFSPVLFYSFYTTLKPRYSAPTFKEIPPINFKMFSPKKNLHCYMWAINSVP